MTDLVRALDGAAAEVEALAASNLPLAITAVEDKLWPLLLRARAEGRDSVALREATERALTAAARLRQFVAVDRAQESQVRG